MGSSAKASKPTEEEKALTATQTDILRQQKDIIEQSYKQQQLIAPYLFKQAGLVPTYGENGEITGFTEESNAAVTQSKEIQDLLGKRTLAALRGELPVDQGLLNELGKQEEQLQEQLRKNLGPGYATSTPGIQALSEFSKNKSAMLDAARRGDVTLAESLGLARANANEASTNEFITRLLGVNAAGAQYSGAYGGVAGGYGSLASLLANRRLAGMGGVSGGQMGAAIGSGALTGAATGAMAGSVIPGIGTLFGAGIGAIGGALGGYARSR